MKSNRAILFLTLLLWTSFLIPVGGGIFLYRYNHQNELEFFFAFDPHRSHTNPQYGFDYPGGNIGPEIKNNYDGNDIDGYALTDNMGKPKPQDKIRTFDFTDPYTFLNGAIRELLEELVFVPALLLQNKKIFIPTLNNSPYKNKRINHNYEKEIVPFIAQHIQNSNGIFFIYKPNVLQQRVAALNHKMAVFFWDITNICPANLPQAIVDQRKNLTNQGINLNNIDAEPIAFAWVKAKHIITALNSNDPWVPFSQFASDDNKLSTHVYKDGKILLANSCLGMMRDRSKDQFNYQPNTVSIQINWPQGFNYILYNNQSNEILEHIEDDITNMSIPQSSSMLAIINFLQKHRTYLEDLLHPNIQQPKSAQSQTPKQPDHSQANTQQVLHPQAQHFVTQALELATLLKK